MIFENIKEEIKDQMKYVLSHYNVNGKDIDFEISESPIKEYGDFSCNVGFLLSKICKKNPYEIAKNIVNDILPDYQNKNTNKSLIESVSIEKPGFINFKINLIEFLKVFFLKISEITKIPSNGIIKELILIEHTSVNPNKALHVGHVRNAVIGDCLYRLLVATKHNVKVLNYVDDSGLQVADIIVAFKYANIPLQEKKINNTTQKFDHYCGNYVYVKINEMYPTRPDLEIERKIVLKELENPHSQISDFTQQIVKRILIDQLQTCWNLKCHYDILNFESQIIQSNLWERIFKILKEMQIIQFETTGKNSGCWIFKSKKEGDKILVRSDSTITYFAKDIPYAMWKLGYIKNPFEFEVFSQQWDQTKLYQTKMIKGKEEYFSNNLIDFDKIKRVITIIDFRQERLQSLLLEILNKIGIEKSNYIYLGYEPVTLSNKTLELLGINLENKKSTQMSGRKGIFIEADTALNLLTNKSYNEVKKRNADISEKEAHNIAKEIAISSIRYYFIKQDMGKTITFDINESLSLDGDTGPYIQYSYARGMRIVNKMDNKIEFSNDIEPLNLNLNLDLSDNEIELIKHLCKFSTIIKESARNYEPKLIAKYLFTLSTLFNNFYESSPILKEDGNKKIIRVKILHSSLLIMNQCMEIIGITPLHKM